jgi:hypothetical protein
MTVAYDADFTALTEALADAYLTIIEGDNTLGFYHPHTEAQRLFTRGTDQAVLAQRAMLDGSVHHANAMVALRRLRGMAA